MGTGVFCSVEGCGEELVLISHGRFLACPANLEHGKLISASGLGIIEDGPPKASPGKDDTAFTVGLLEAVRQRGTPVTYMIEGVEGKFRPWSKLTCPESGALVYLAKTRRRKSTEFRRVLLIRTNACR